MRTRARGLATAIVIATVAACTALELGSQHQQLTALDTTQYSFGMVPLGVASGGGPFTVKPAGGSAQMDNDFITSIRFDTVCPDFALQDGGGATYGGYLIGSSDGNLYGLNGGPHVYWDCTGGSGSGTGGTGGTTGCVPVTYPFYATFTPSSTNPQQCVARVYTSSGSGAGPGSSNTITFSGSGQASSYSIAANPTTLDFGTVQMGGSSAPQTVTVTNTGTSDITISGSYSDLTYKVTPPVGSAVSLVPGMGETYTVYCAPTDTASHDDTLAFTGAGSGSGSDASATVTLACTGTGLNLRTSPNPVDFNSHLVGAPPETRMVTITNQSASTVDLSGWSFMGAPPQISFAQTPGAGVTLVAGGSTQVTIRYDPSAPENSGSLGSFVFAANSTQYSVPMIGTTLVGSLGANPAAIDFGPVCEGGAGSAVDVQVSTNAAGTVRVTQIEMPTLPLAATASAMLPATLAGSGVGSLTVHASIAPTATTAPGPFASAIKLDTNIPGAGATMSIPVSATVLQGGVGVTPASVSFGPEMLNTLSEGKQIVLTNCGSAAMTIMDARISPATETEFSIEAPANPGTLNKTLQIGESQMFAVQFDPTRAGDQAAKLVLDTDSGIQEIPLDGTGYGSSSGGSGKERETYYACSTGGPAGMLPLAIVGVGLALGRRRRRRR